MTLTQQQQNVLEQIKNFLESDAGVFILRGYAGTGKTTMIKTIADYCQGKRNVKLVAPTGRAARVLDQKAGHEATTIHKCIYASPKVESTENEDIANREYKMKFFVAVPEKHDKIVMIVDEASMVSSRNTEQEQFIFGTDNLMDDLLTYVRPSFGGKVIFVGDPAQLPPVGDAQSNALNTAFFVERGFKVQEAELTEVVRQKGDSVILKNAMKIRQLLGIKQRNQFAFEEAMGEVESVQAEAFLQRYYDSLKQTRLKDNVVICYSNRDASRYNQDIRRHIWSDSVPTKSDGIIPLQVDDVLMVTKNNYNVGLMNGDFTTIVSIGGRIQQSAPVYMKEAGQLVRKVVTINFIGVEVEVGEKRVSCMLIEDLLDEEKPNLSVDENRALYINFCMRYPHLKENTEIFQEALLNDPYFNALRAKYGYAVTGHKCQGGEWPHVFVDYYGKSGMDDDSLRWTYTATTRAQKTLCVTNLLHITPFSKFRIDPIQKCKSVDAECRVLGNVGSTPYHGVDAADYLRAKCQCVMENMKGTPFGIDSVVSNAYLEIYQIRTPQGVCRYDLYYKIGGIFQQAKAVTPNEYTDQVLLLLNDERRMPYVMDYKPSGDLYMQLFSMIRSACDALSIPITNVVEHPEDYTVLYYFKTSGVHSYLKIYVNAKGMVTYAKPMSMLGGEDNELQALVYEINRSFV